MVMQPYHARSPDQCTGRLDHAVKAEAFSNGDSLRGVTVDVLQKRFGIGAILSLHSSLHKPQRSESAAACVHSMRPTSALTIRIQNN